VHNLYARDTHMDTLVSINRQMSIF
jgi:hypothetical protein